jgi:hypothetical protein
MVKRSLSWLAPLLLAAYLALPAAAQTKNDGAVDSTRWRSDNPGSGLPAIKDSLPVMEFVVATCGCVLVLFILCTPSRKR